MHRCRVLKNVRILFFQISDQHPKLRAPVADVVLPDNTMAGKFIKPGNAVADNGTAQVADVHLLGDIGAGVIYHDAAGGLGLVYAQPSVSRCIPINRSPKRVLQPQVINPAPRRWAVRYVVKIPLPDHPVLPVRDCLEVFGAAIIPLA